MKKVINICFLWMCQLALFGQARIGDNPDYNPTNPGDPEIVRTYKFSTSVTPENAGGTNFSGTTRYVEGASINIQAYNNTGYQFVYWLLDDSVISTSASFTYTMPAKDVTITGVFEYNPSNPSNPGKNSWNEATGEVLIDDFTAGSLYSAITSAIGGSSSYRQKVTQITVSGKMSSSDVSVAGNFSNCTLLDLKRTYGYADVPDYAYDYNTSLTSIVLPASIENIGYRAFYQAVNLADVTCYAITPPTVENDAFNGIAEGAVLHVLSAAIPLYAEAEGWKDFTILPLIEEVQALEVNLPAGSEDGRYKNMTLELVNAESGQRQKYVISNRVTYTFDALQKNNIFNVYVKSSQNVVLGKIEHIVIEDKDVAVTFESLLQPQDVTLKVQTSDGTDVTSQTQIRWFDSADNYLQQGNRLAGFLAGTAVRYHITLPQTLGMQYVLPADSVFTIQEGGNALVCTLQPLDEVTISGRVKDATTGGTLSGAVVSVSQKLNGLYSKAFTVKTDNKGEFTAKVFNDQSLITVSATDYLNQTLEFANFNDVTFVGEVALENNAGVTITTNLTYTTSVAEGETAEVQNWYADYANVAYEIYNETQQRAITQFDVQYPSIVLQEEVAEGDLLTLTASSRTNSFAPIKATITISAQMREEVTFSIVELGGIKASFTSTDNTSVVGILYDSKGQFVKRYTYGNASLSISDLLDGNYTLVTMTESKQFNSILNLSQFAASGLKEGVDYVQDEVTVKSGVVTTISNDLIPVLDESKFYYTGDNTLFSVNKTSIIVGSYLTLRGKIDFKSAYASQVSNVSMVVDLPESCTFVENSVMVGSGIASYTLDGNRLTIPLTDKSTDLVRFCIIPTVGGFYAPNAFAQFALDGEEVLQPIGNANFAVENLTLSVPSMVAETAVPIRGMALGNSTIEIFDNGVKIGETTSLANGLWNAVCELNEPYNLSTHSIYAKVTTKQGVELLSETQECMYDKNTIEVKTVTMINISHRVGDYYEEKTVFDFQNPSTSIPAYWYWPDYPEFTFLIDFTDNDTTKISNVVLYVKTTEDNKVPLKASYDEKKNLWVTSGEFGNWSNYDIPVSVAVDFEAHIEKLFDRTLINEKENAIKRMQADVSDVKDSVLLANEKILEMDSLMQSTESKLVELEKQFSIDGISFSEVDEYLSVLGIEIDIEDFDLNLPEFDNDELDIFVDSLLMIGESLLSNNTIDENIENVVLDSLTHELITSIEETVDWQNSLNSNLDTIEYKFGNQNYIIHPVSYTEVDYSIMDSTNTIKIGMTDNHSILLYFSNSEYLIVDSINMEAWHIKMESTMSYARSLVRNEDGLLQLYGAIESIQNWWTIIQDAIEFKIEDYKKQIEVCENLISSHKNEEIKLAVSFSKKGNEIKAIEKQIAMIEKTITLEDANKETELWTQKLKLESQREGLLKDIKYREKRINALKKQQIALGAKLIPIKEMLGNFADLLQMGKNVYRIIDAIHSAIKDVNKWNAFISSILPCEHDKIEANMLKKNSENDRNMILAQYVGSVTCSTVATGLTGYFLMNKSAKFIFDFISGKISDFLSEVSSNALQTAKHNSISKFATRNSQKDSLKCNDEDKCPRCGKDPCECEDECPECGNMPCTCDEVCSKCGQNPCVCDEDKCPICGMNYCEHFQPPYVDPVHDPSGFVYEGVSSNRLEGVMASCYYKETVEDMYGDLHENVVLWDAEQYAQENPLFTDENGMYRWDVPQGLWQVKFEKEGYQTTYSEWLPVPPPQLEVNIGMAQNKQPEVKAARAYEDGIDVEFDKYMQPDGLTIENIFVTKNGETVAGTVTLLNEEQAYEDNSTTYASKVRFVPETSFLTTDEVLLTVSRKVKSYAGIQMESDYTQSFDIEKEVKSIVADSLIKVAYNGDKEITVSALPYDAAIGKKMIVKNSSSIITSVSADTLTLDENGQAALTLNGDLPGTAMLTFTLADVDVQASSTVQVVSPELLMTASPKATRASGTAVYRGTEVGLTCATEGAVIYYTLDGSCPCDENAPRMIYEHPIAINEDMTIKAMAVVEDREESDVAEFSFTIKTTNLGMNLKKGWNWVSHNMETEIPTSVLPQNATRIVGQTAELIKDPAYGLLGNLKTLQPTEAYKVQMDDNFTYAMSGYEFNPATVISLRSGWNWLGFPVSQTMSLNEAFANMQPDNEDYIVGQDGFAQYADGVWTGTLQTLNPGMGYLYHSQNDKAFVYNRAIVSKARSVYGRGIKNETPWTVDKNKYPNVMSMIADFHVNGQKTAAGNYAVGAFCGTECRGVGKYVNGKLMISIYGNGNEKITFRAMNNETEEMFDIVEQTIFAETLLGSLYQPYTLNIGGATSVSEIGTNWKVWPTVATDNLYLSLDGKTFDRVTLTDVYGHVALVKENVADGEAIRIGSLADGVYIITAVQGGDTYYKKIVKAGK